MITLIAVLLIVQTAWSMYRDVEFLYYQRDVNDIQDEFNYNAGTLRENAEKSRREADYWHVRFMELSEKDSGGKP